jgi:hypothetical protein
MEVRLEVSFGDEDVGPYEITLRRVLVADLAHCPHSGVDSGSVTHVDIVGLPRQLALYRGYRDR